MFLSNFDEKIKCIPNTPLIKTHPTPIQHPFTHSLHLDLG